MASNGFKRHGFYVSGGHGLRRWNHIEGIHVIRIISASVLEILDSSGGKVYEEYEGISWQMYACKRM
jgi:hypothetical protein